MTVLLDIQNVTDDVLLSQIEIRKELLDKMVGDLYSGIVKQELAVLQSRWDALIAYPYINEGEVKDGQLEAQIGLRIALAQTSSAWLSLDYTQEASRLTDRLYKADAYKLEHPGLTIDPNDPGLKAGGSDNQQDVYLVLPDEELAKGFVRPLRRKYKHQKCWITTIMSVKLAETWARDPKFYGATYCAACGDHFPVSMFWWIDEDGKETKQELGT